MNNPTIAAISTPISAGAIGLVRMSAFGIFSFRVTRPEVFLREIFGTLPTYTTRDIVGYLRRMVVSRLADVIGELQTPIIDLVSSYDELGEAGRTRMQPSFEAIGLSLQQLIIESISLPEEVEKVIDKRTSVIFLLVMIGSTLLNLSPVWFVLLAALAGIVLKNLEGGAAK